MKPTFVVQDDTLLRQVELLLDPDVPADRTAAFVDYYAHDVPDFAAWRDALRAQVPRLYPSEVRLIASEGALQDELAAADVLIVEHFRVGESELQRAPKLKAVQQFGLFKENVDEQACRAHSVPLLRLRRRTNIAVAEHTIMLMLALAKRLPATNGVVTAGRLAERGMPWRPFDRRHTSGANFGRIPGIRMVAGSTLGLLGFGEIAREVAVCARALGMRVLYHKRRRLAPDTEREAGAEYCAFDELFASADIVSLHIPLMPETRGMVNRSALCRMKRGALLINVSRAAIVERNALVDAIASGQLGGAAFDVLYHEPTTPDDPLLGHENVIVTPHIAGGSRLNLLMDIEEMLLGISRVLDGAR